MKLAILLATFNGENFGSYEIQVGKQNLLTLEKSSFPVIR